MGLISIRLMNAPTSHVPANPPHVHTAISDDKRSPSELFMHQSGPSVYPMWSGVYSYTSGLQMDSFFLSCLVSSSIDLQVLLNLPCRWLRGVLELGKRLWPMAHSTHTTGIPLTNVWFRKKNTFVCTCVYLCHSVQSFLKC